MSYQLEPQLATTKADRLYAALADMSSTDDVKAFLRDVLTVEELEEAIGRYEAARLLSEGLSYRSIASETGMSTTTVTRIAYWLHHGTGGYRRALLRISES